ncbi:MAG: hypothetical protein ACTHQM_04490 [Thermoanaerobaculia bacterium]
MTSSNLVLYGSGLFGRNIPKLNRLQLGAVQQSGFTTVILWTLHVDSDGTLVYNNTVIVRDGCFSPTFAYLPDLVNELTSLGSVQNVLFCIGSGGVNDFTNINTLLGTHAGKLTLIRNFNALSSALNIQGYDFDDEDYFETPTSNAPGPVVELTNILADNNHMIITWCPYFGQTSFWNPALQLVYQNDQQNGLAQSVQWWNLQCYSGGFGNDPGTWASSLPTNAGIASPQQFIVPGLDTSGGTSAVQSQFASWKSTDAGLNGGFMWNSGDIFASTVSPQQYALAIEDGLQGQS